MASLTRFDEIIDAFNRQSNWCQEFGSSFTSQLIGKLAEDFGKRGIVFELISSWKGNIIADALALRICGAFHYLALSGNSPQLRAIYPPQNSNWNITEIWPIALMELHSRKDWFADFIISPPQTNEVRRAIGLYLGICRAAQNWDGPIDILELGASAGLNQNLDMFDYNLPDFKKQSGYGVELGVDDWRGNQFSGGRDMKFRNRAACDQNPLNPEHDGLMLQAYIWPDQKERLDRCQAAIDLACAQKTSVDKADAADWTTQKLQTRANDALTIIFHSVFFQYPPEKTRTQINKSILTAISNSSKAAPLAWVRLEPSAVLFGIDGKTMQTDNDWPSIGHIVDVIDFDFDNNTLRRRILARIDPHVRWIDWQD